MGRIRAINTPGNEVGHQRNDLYKHAIVRINRAIKDGYYFEAITLIESIITDRLESYLSRVFNDDVSFKTLGDLIGLFGKPPKNSLPDEELTKLVTIDLDNWRKKRNKSLHQMVKIAEGDLSTWKKKSQDLPQIAEEGQKLMETIKTWTVPGRSPQECAAKFEKEQHDANERFISNQQYMDYLRNNGTKEERKNFKKTHRVPEDWIPDKT